MKRLSHVVGRGLMLGLIWILMGAPGALAADEPGKQGTAPSGDVQERGFQRGTFGGQLGTATRPPVIDPRPTGFYCLQSKNTCYCDRTETADCDLMKAYACVGGTYKDTTVLDGECTSKIR
jgi:hypothetical protein